jgi:hypothetical protein
MKVLRNKMLLFLIFLFLLNIALANEPSIVEADFYRFYTSDDFSLAKTVDLLQKQSKKSILEL